MALVPTRFLNTFDHSENHSALDFIDAQIMPKYPGFAHPWHEFE